MGLIDTIEPIEELERFPIDTFRRGQNTLKLKFTNASDAGNFDCQVSTNPKISQIFKLNIIGIIEKNSFLNYAKCCSAICVRGGGEGEARDGRLPGPAQVLHQELPQAAHLCVLVSSNILRQL